jgi:two-component system phosphate regulon response regulator PhoB
MATVLVVEDETDLREVLEYNLRKDGHEVFTCDRGSSGIALAREHRPDVVLLDLMLPDIPGTEVCRALRSDPLTRATAVMMLTARSEEVDRVVSFELGADDYMVKPFSLRELALRIQAILRRANPSSETAEDHVRFGCLRFDRAAHRVWVESDELDLTALEFRLLVTLHDRRNRVQTRSTLLEGVWGIEGDIHTRTVDTHVKRLREKLGAARDYIETVRGVGYRFCDAPPDVAASIDA